MNNKFISHNGLERIAKILFAAFFLSLFFGQNLFCESKSNRLRITAIYDGEIVGNNLGIYKFRSDEYFSIRDVAKIYGARLDWHQISGKVSLLMNNRKIDFYIKSTKIVIDSRSKHLKLPNHLISGMVYIPSDFVLSNDFADFTATNSNFNPQTNILTVEKKVNIYPPRFYSDEDYTRVEIEMADKLSYQINEKSKGKIEIEFQRAKLEKETINVSDGVINDIDVREKGRQALVTIYLTAAAGRVSSSLLENPLRLEFEIRRTLLADNLKKDAFICLLPEPVTGLVSGSTSTVHVTSAAPVAITGLVATPKTIPVVVTGLAEKTKAEPKKNIKKIILVLDAGHGGEDPGAIGQNGTEEKHINLAIVKELQILFEKKDADTYEIITTRYDDTFIPLLVRTKIANDKFADLFVSIHCNASMKKKTKGFEIYFLSETASNKEALATEILENSVLELEGKLHKNVDKVKNILKSMRVNEYMNESSELCCFIDQDVTKRTKVENRGIMQANFCVLRGAAMPAVLVECAFLSNLEEESLLKTRKYQRKVADAIYEGIKKYQKRRELLSAQK